MSEIEEHAQDIILDPTNPELAERFVLSLRSPDGLFRAQEDDCPSSEFLEPMAA